MNGSTPEDAPLPVSRTSLPGNQLAASAARRFLRATFAEWATRGLLRADSVTGRLADDAVLLVSELVTNAVIHAGTAVEVLCRLDAPEGRGHEAAHEAGPGHETVRSEAGPGPGHEAAGLVIEVSDQHPARVVRSRDGSPRDGRDGGRGLQMVAALSDSWGITYRRELKTVWCRLAFEDTAYQDRAPRRDPDVAELLAPAPSPASIPLHDDSDWVHRGSLSFLAEASDLLAGQLDEDKVAVLAGQLLVPRLADWCAVWLHGSGAEPRLARVWHASENHIDGLRMALEKEPPPVSLRAGAMPWPWPGTMDPWDPGGGALACPLVVGGRSHGTLLLGRTGLGRVPDEVIGLIEDFARRVALAIDTARQYARQANISTVLQRGLLPTSLADRIPGVETAVVYEPTGGVWVGGDFYDIFAAGNGRWCFALGDVCGNGPEAAAVAGLARPVMRLLAREGYGVSDVLDRLNRALADEAAATAIADGAGAAWEGGHMRFLSLLYGEIVPDPSGRGARCTLGSAGHPLPLLLGPDGAVREAASPQMLLGIADDAKYHSESFDLMPGDTLLCVTDGVTERRRGGRQFDDDDGLASVLGGCAGLGAQEVAERIRRAVHDYDAAPPDDDVALLVLQAQ